MLCKIDPLLYKYLMFTLGKVKHTYVYNHKCNVPRATAASSYVASVFRMGKRT